MSSELEARMKQRVVDMEADDNSHYLMSFLQNGLSEVDFSWAGRGEPGCVRSGRGGPVVDDADDLIDGERDDAEHEMAFDLERAADAEKSGAELVFQTGVDAFGHGAEIVDQVVEVGHVDELQALDLAAPFGLALVVGAKVAVDDGGVAERPALGVDRGGVVGGVHEIVEIGDAGARHSHQGDGDLAVVDGGRGQYAGDRDLAAGHVDVEFVPGPGLFVALAVFLAADVAGGRQVGEHLAEVLRDLPLETRRLRLRPLLVLAGTSALARRRGIIGRRGIVFAVVGLHLDRLLARFDLGGVARDRPNDASPERTLDQRGVDLVWQLAARELGERPGKRGFGRNLRASLESRGCDAGTCRRRGARSGRWWWERKGPPWPRKLGRGRDGPRAAGPAPWAARARRLRGRSRRAW